MRVLRQEMADWVEQMSPGLEQMGATRTVTTLEGILVRDSDEAGDATFPIFQRDGFGNQFDNWDSP